ncbi:hypothetical protein RB213_006509, partial [Colletotrichum asianum]
HGHVTTTTITTTRRTNERTNQQASLLGRNTRPCGGEPSMSPTTHTSRRVPGRLSLLMPAYLPSLHRAVRVMLAASSGGR